MRHKWTEEDHLLVQEMTSKGFTVMEIAKETGFSEGSIKASRRRTSSVLPSAGSLSEIALLKEELAKIKAELDTLKAEVTTTTTEHTRKLRVIYKHTDLEELSSTPRKGIQFNMKIT